ncbi:hypothetical protein ISCGN_010601 [Ixodes scapularis]
MHVKSMFYNEQHAGYIKLFSPGKASENAQANVFQPVPFQKKKEVGKKENFPKAQVVNKIERREAIQKGRKLKSTLCMHAQKKKKKLFILKRLPTKRSDSEGDKLHKQTCAHKQNKTKNKI